MNYIDENGVVYRQVASPLVYEDEVYVIKPIKDTPEKRDYNLYLESDVEVLINLPINMSEPTAKLLAESLEALVQMIQSTDYKDWISLSHAVSKARDSYRSQDE